MISTVLDSSISAEVVEVDGSIGIDICMLGIVEYVCMRSCMRG